MHLQMNLVDDLDLQQNTMEVFDDGKQIDCLRQT